MNVQVSNSSLNNANSDVLIAFTQQKTSKNETKVQCSGISKEIKALLDSEPNYKAANKETLFFRGVSIDGFQHILFIGLGSNKDTESMRQAAAVAFNAANSLKIKTVTINFDSVPATGKADMMAQALTEGIVLSSYRFDDHKKKKADKAPNFAISSANATKNRQIKKGIETGEILATATNLSRWLGDSPGNKMPPKTLADVTVKEAKGSKLKVTVMNKAAMKKKKMGALLGVAAGSDQDPRMIVMEYKGAAASKRPVCFVGKGLTFDSGGISLKPGAGMEEMKYDMCGGANVIGAMMAIARLKLKVNVIGIVPASENMPGPSATKPGDILTAMDGTTIEVDNTDAEGRLILSDALCLAKTYKPAFIVDAATLTGAMVIALGSSFTGVFSNDKKLVKKIESAAATTGENVWHLPLSQDHTNDIKGSYADLRNIGNSREAGSATAAAFLKHFIEEGTPWAHFDIAGTAWHAGKRYPYAPKKGASGCMVRTFVELAKNHK